MSIKLLNGDMRTVEYKHWNKWISSIDKLVKRYSDVDFDLFAYNETASVSLLVAVAVDAKMIALAEFISNKLHPNDRRIKVTGRCDFWLYDSFYSWAFEFKQKHYLGGDHKTSTILGWLEQAYNDALSLPKNQGYKRFGGLIIPL